MDIKDKVDKLQNIIFGLDHIDVSSIDIFEKEMRTARTSSFFNNERQERYRALNFDYLLQSQFLDISTSETNRRTIKIAIIKKRLLRIKSSFVEDYY